MKLLTTAQAGRYAGVSGNTVRRWIDTGLLPGHRLPFERSRRRVDPRDLVKFLRKHGNPVPPELERMVSNAD